MSDPATDYVATATADAALQARLSTLRTRIDPSHGVVGVSRELSETTLNQVALSHILELGINGGAALKEQKVIVEYLRNDQRLLLPAAMGMWEGDKTMTPIIPVLADRYARLATMKYSEMRAFITPAVRARDLITALRAIETPSALVIKTDWKSDSWFIEGGVVIDQPVYGHMVMAILSQVLQFNCDVRDFGALGQPNMTVADTEWRDVSEVVVARLNNKIMPFTLQSIAALNLGQTQGCELAAWTRAYGVAMGILPSSSSRCIKEYAFTTDHPTQENRTKVIEYDKAFEKPMNTLCANILAMFGLFHLNKDHTFKTGDQNMERIGKSYIQTLRTDSSTTVVEYMLQHQEAIVRTGPHPFGLAQTYWLARVLYRCEKMMTPLRQRIDATPPPVQRMMICDATAREWDGLPSGTLISEFFAEELALIRFNITEVKANPPEFSSLATLYGLAGQARQNVDLQAAISKMMPCVYGYISATHMEGEKGKDGLGFALSLANVQRDARGLTMAWSRAWDKYIASLDDIGLKDFVNDMQAARNPRRIE